MMGRRNRLADPCPPIPKTWPELCSGAFEKIAAKRLSEKKKAEQRRMPYLQRSLSEWTVKLSL